MAQIYFFTGENAFQLREERRQWIARFAAKHGEENLLRLDAPSVTFRALLDEVGVAPFIAAKRLVVVDGTPRFDKEEVESLPQLMHPDCLLLLCDGKPDKRLGGAKAFLKIAETKEFTPLEGRPLRDWMKVYAAANGSRLEDAAVDRLLEIAGTEQQMLAQEIQKLCTAHPGGPIAPADVDRLAVPSGEQEVWRLTNLLSQGRIPDALLYARTLTQQGEDPFSLWAILLWMLRSLVSVKAAVDGGQRNPARIASEAGVPFPTARTLQPYAEKISIKRLAALVDWAANADIQLKTGGYRATGEAPQEMTALVDVFILRCGALAAG